MRLQTPIFMQPQNMIPCAKSAKQSSFLFTFLTQQAGIEFMQGCQDTAQWIQRSCGSFWRQSHQHKQVGLLPLICCYSPKQSIESLGKNIHFPSVCKAYQIGRATCSDRRCFITCFVKFSKRHCLFAGRLPRQAVKEVKETTRLKPGTHVCSL